MPKSEIKITRYEGMIGNADERDLPDGLAVYARNLDMAHSVGLFEPLKDDTVESSANIIGTRFEKFSDASGNEIAAYRNTSDSTIRYLSNLDSSPPLTTNTSLTRSVTDGTGTAASDGQAAHMGFGGNSSSSYDPIWLGYVGHLHFSIPDGDPNYPTQDVGIVADEAKLTADNIHTKNNVTTPTDNWQIKLPLEGTDSTSTGRRYDNDTVVFKLGIRYAYWVSLVYDGYQESPLRYLGSLTLSKSTVGVQITSGSHITPSLIEGVIGSTASSNTSTTSWSASNWQTAVNNTTGQTKEAAQGASKISFYIHARTLSDGSEQEMNRRVTGMNIYRKEQIAGTAQMGAAKFLKYISINDPGWTATGAGDNRGAYYSGHSELPDGYYYWYLFEDDIRSTQETFEDRTGYPETVENMDLHWGLSAAIDGWHIIGRCWNSQLEETQSWLFRSKKWRFDTFDWTQDYLVLPTAPSAMIAYRNRVYCFSDGRAYIVNPGTFDLEDTIEGIGCEDNRSVTVSDRGMFWCDKNNIYFHDGSRINLIGTPILRNVYESDVGFEERDTGQVPIAVYSSEYDSFLMFFKGGDANYYAYMYHVLSDRWTLVQLSGAITALNGVVYRTNGQPMLSVSVSGSPTLYELFASSSDRAWEWVGLARPSIGRKSVFYKARVSHRTNAPDVYYYPDDLAYASNAGSGHLWGSPTADGSHVTEGQINQKTGGTWDYTRDLALRVVGAAGEDATDISLIVREITPR